jgi:hypothetical protein
MRSIEEQVNVDHVAWHVIGPFECLGLNADQECIRRPAAKDHCFCRRVLHEEQGHGSAGPKGLVANLMGVKLENVESPKHGAGAFEQFSDKVVTDFDSLSVNNCGAERPHFVPTRDGCDDSLDGWTPAQDWAKELLTGSWVGWGIHFLPVLLVVKDDSHMLGMVQEFWIGVQEHLTGSQSENNASHLHLLGLAHSDWLSVLARAHRKKESAQCKVPDVG